MICPCGAPAAQPGLVAQIGWGRVVDLWNYGRDLGGVWTVPVCCEEHREIVATTLSCRKWRFKTRMRLPAPVANHDLFNAWWRLITDLRTYPAKVTT